MSSSFASSLYHSGNSLQNGYKFSKVSCRVNEVNMHKNTNTNFYQVLSLSSRNADLNEIKRAYRSLALQCHPDACHDHSRKEESTRRFVELQTAYKTLSDPISRSMYDRELGLIDSVGFGVGFAYCKEERRSNFPKHVWENQLRGLKRRSSDRMGRKMSNC